jgi:hypothetical protein
MICQVASHPADTFLSVTWFFAKCISTSS